MPKFRRHVVVWMTRKGVVRLLMSCMLLVTAGLLLGRSVPVTDTWSYWSMPLSGKVIAIDAGHGGVDGGAVSRDGIIEKELNLAIALHVRDYLQQAGAIVVMTREGDYDLATGDAHAYRKRKSEDLRKRVDMIKQSDAELLVSIHMNSVPSSRWTGAQTFFKAGNHGDNPTLSFLLQDEIKRNLANTDRLPATVKNVYLLEQIKTIPAALVEVGFLSNPGEAHQLADIEYQRKVAASIYMGILRYMSGEQPLGKAES